MDQNLRQLACAITLQAVKDFCAGDAANRRAILKDLRSPYMDFITNGTSRVVAEELVKNPEEIAERIRYLRTAKES